MSPLLWTCQSTQQLAEVLCQEGNRISPDTVGRLLAEMGYSLQANLKTLEEGANHPDRDEQFHYLNSQVRRFLRQGDPVISVDTKKKELMGRYSNKGRQWRPQGEPEKVKIHDFIDLAEPQAIPYGIYREEIVWIPMLRFGCWYGELSSQPKRTILPPMRTTVGQSSTVFMRFPRHSRDSLRPAI